MRARHLLDCLTAALLLLPGCERGVGGETQAPAYAAKAKPRVSEEGSKMQPNDSAHDGALMVRSPEDKRAQGLDPATAPELEVAILAGGCFWGMEDIIRKIPGVVATEVGYTGGRAGVTYQDMHHDTTGNAEAVRILFDPKRLGYEDLLENWFFRMHDPTTANRQGNDVGPQYRSVIFATTPAQREAAARVKQRVDASHKWPRPVVTQIADAGPFTVAEDYHQDYLQKNPGGYTCHYLRDFPKLPE